MPPNMMYMSHHPSGFSAPPPGHQNQGGQWVQQWVPQSVDPFSTPPAEIYPDPPHPIGEPAWREHAAAHVMSKVRQVAPALWQPQVGQQQQWATQRKLLAQQQEDERHRAASEVVQQLRSELVAVQTQLAAVEGHAAQAVKDGAALKTRCVVAERGRY